MLISKEKNKYAVIDKNRAKKGQFNTKHSFWFTNPVKNFFEKKVKKADKILDPFAGEGDILFFLKKKYKKKIIGYDIDKKKWKKNDSLKKIPTHKNTIICTNPPYLAKYSAKRKRVFKDVKDYYSDTIDLYHLALQKCFKATRYTIAIIPETFINSSFPKNHLVLLSVIIKNPFTTTENPVVVACFDNQFVEGDKKAKVYIANKFICKFGDLEKNRIKPKNNHKIYFNDPKGNLALKAVDGVQKGDLIRFEKTNGFYYSRSNIKVSSRLLTYIKIPNLNEKKVSKLIQESNRRLQRIRKKTKDLILSPFKGNNKSGNRRRRLDYKLARGIIEKSMIKGEKGRMAELVDA